MESGGNFCPKNQKHLQRSISSPLQCFVIKCNRKHKQTNKKHKELCLGLDIYQMCAVCIFFFNFAIFLKLYYFQAPEPCWLPAFGLRLPGLGSGSRFRLWLPGFGLWLPGFGSGSRVLGLAPGFWSLAPGFWGWLPTFGLRLPGLGSGSRVWALAPGFWALAPGFWVWLPAFGLWLPGFGLAPDFLPSPKNRSNKIKNLEKRTEKITKMDSTGAISDF